MVELAISTGEVVLLVEMTELSDTHDSVEQIPHVCTYSRPPDVHSGKGLNTCNAWMTLMQLPQDSLSAGRRDDDSRSPQHTSFKTRRAPLVSMSMAPVLHLPHSAIPAAHTGELSIVPDPVWSSLECPSRSPVNQTNALPAEPALVL